MRCPETDNQEFLLAYCAGRLGSRETAKLEAHLAQCAACRFACEGQTAVWKALDEWEAEPVASDFGARLLARIASEEPTGWRRWWSEWRQAFAARPVAAALAVLFMMVAGFWLLPQGAPREPRADAAFVREIEIIEATLDDLEMVKELSGGDRPEGAQSL